VGGVSSGENEASEEILAIGQKKNSGNLKVLVTQKVELRTDQKKEKGKSLRAREEKGGGHCELELRNKTTLGYQGEETIKESFGSEW